MWIGIDDEWTLFEKKKMWGVNDWCYVMGIDGRG